MGILRGCNAGGDGEAASKEDCLRVQQHMAKLRVASVKKNSKLSAAELAKHQANFAVTSDAALEACAEERSERWVGCMLDLKSSQNAKDCE